MLTIFYGTFYVFTLGHRSYYHFGRDKVKYLYEWKKWMSVQFDQMLPLGNENSSDRCIAFGFQALFEYVEYVVVGFKESICFLTVLALIKLKQIFLSPIYVHMC